MAAEFFFVIFRFAEERNVIAPAFGDTFVGFVPFLLVFAAQAQREVRACIDLQVDGFAQIGTERSQYRNLQIHWAEFRFIRVFVGFAFVVFGYFFPGAARGDEQPRLEVESVGNGQVDDGTYLEAYSRIEIELVFGIRARIRR